MTLQDLKTDVNNELSFTRALPYSLPDKEIERIITIASRYFYDNWQYAVQSRYLHLPLSLFQSEQFKKYREIQLPDCVGFVWNVKEIKNQSIFGTIDRDFSEQKFIGSEIFLTPFMGESIVYRTVIFSFLDLTKNLVLDTISTDYNKNNHILEFRGRTPKVDVIVEFARKIEIEHLYDDELFQRYVRAKAKVRLGELLTAFKYKLPGGVEVSYDTMVTRAADELKEILDQMKSEKTIHYMILDRQ